MKKRIITALVAVIASAALFHTGAAAQNVSDLIINEVMADEGSGLVDAYGNRSGWIEIFNASFGTVDFGGCYLSDDKDNLKKYFIPRGDAATKLPPRQITVFYACGVPEKGTFYTNFTLAPGSVVYLTSNDGRTVIDSIEIPADIPYGKSVARIALDNKGKSFKTEIADPTPLSQNGDPNIASKSQVMAQRDPHGWIMTVTAISVVFLALIILSIVYGWLGKFFTRKKGETSPKKAPAAKSSVKKGAMSDEVALAIALALDREKGGETEAAIALALHLYSEDSVHDVESGIITIRPTFGPYASRQFTLRQMPQKKQTK